jgi:hypothetical protein
MTGARIRPAAGAGDTSAAPHTRPRASLRTLIPLRPCPRGRQSVHTRIEASPMGQGLSHPRRYSLVSQIFRFYQGWHAAGLA